MIALAALNILADAAARRPVLVIVDDVQWLDRPTQEVLAFIARRVSVDPIVLIASVRAGHDVPLTSAGLIELTVGGLDDESARDLLAENAGDLSYADRQRILRGAQGNPLGLVELPTALRASAAAGLELLPEELYREALRADLIRWPWLRAKIELAYGCWLRRQRRVGESRKPLRSAQTTFELIGAGSWAEQARSELRASGERTTTSGPAAQGMLSAQEPQIAKLAADGLSNREIGQRLYLSPRTVGSHLYRIFPKLDITSRAQLASRLESVPQC